MPTGPTMSGPAPDASWVESVSRALAYGIGLEGQVDVRVRGVERLGDCLLDLDLVRTSPVPRQQYQRISTSPGLAVEAVPGSRRAGVGRGCGQDAEAAEASVDVAAPDD